MVSNFLAFELVSKDEDGEQGLSCFQIILRNKGLRQCGSRQLRVAETQHRFDERCTSVDGAGKRAVVTIEVHLTVSQKSFSHNLRRSLHRGQI